MTKHHGFTLMELMISMAIFALLMFVLFSAFYQTVQSWSISEGLVESQQDARIASDWLAMELHEAVNFTNSTSFVLTPDYATASSTDTVTFTLSTGLIDAGIFSNGAPFAMNTVTYSLSSGILTRTINYSTGVSSTFEVAGNIQSFTVSHILIDTTSAYSYPNNIYDPYYFTISVYAQTTVSSTVTQTTTGGGQIHVENYALITDVQLRNELR